MPRTSPQQGAQQPASGRGNVSPMDHSVLEKLLCEDREAVGVVLRQFRSSCPGDASALGVALSRNDNKGALRWAHRLKGACQMVGAARLAEVCERVEGAVRAGDPGLTAQAVADIEFEAGRITGYLDAWLKANT